MFKNWFCLVGFSVFLASGKIDGLWGGTLKMDVAAGIIILLESGGKITTTTNKKYTFGKTFVATNKLIHNELLKLLKKIMIETSAVIYRKKGRINGRKNIFTRSQKR